jgi:acetyl esterase/lipase
VTEVDAWSARRPAARGTLAQDVLARALLTSIATVWLTVPGVVVLGGYLPDLPTVGSFGFFLTTDLPAVGLLALPPIGLVGLALRLGGGKFAKVLFSAALIVLGGAGVAGGALWTTANANGATYSPIRQITAAPAFGGLSERIVFATVDGVDLHADLWPAAHNPEVEPAPAPAFVFVHGGGFVGGELGSRRWLFRAVADAGFNVMDDEYRHAPPPRWTHAPGDVLCALAWVREHGPDLGIDIHRVVLAGDSAGASLALTAGYFAGLDPGGVPAHIRSSCFGAPVVPSGIVAIEPAADLEGIWRDRTIQDGPDGTTFPEAYIGGTPAEYPDRYAIDSPWDRMRPDIPPTLIITGANDHLVRLPRVQSIADGLAEVHAPYRLIVIPFADHGLDGLPSSAGSQLLEVLLPRFVADPRAVIRE